MLDTAAKNREGLLYDRYRAGRDVIARFTKDPPYAYIIPRQQRDPATAALLAGKLMVAVYWPPAASAGTSQQNPATLSWTGEF